MTPGSRQPLSESQKAIQSLVAGFISHITFITATLVWMVELFTAVFGFGARSLISDYFQGISLIFKDIFTVGEKIKLPDPNPVEGIIEAISLRATSFRTPSEELYLVPSGEIRTVRIFSQGKSSLVC